MLTARLGPLVTSVIGAPLRKPATRESELDRPPAQSEYCVERRVASVAGALAAGALPAKVSAARDATIA